MNQALEGIPLTPSATVKERLVLARLVQAWNEYLQLPVQHPHDQEEFMRAIHAAQQLIAIRAARRVDPELWSTYG